MSTLLEPSSIREIAERGFGVLAFGTAPDGLTWLTRIDAPPSAEDLLRGVASALGVIGAHPLAGTPLGPVVEQVDTLVRARRFQSLAAVEGEPPAPVLVLPKLVRSLTGETLLGRILPAPTGEQDAPRRVENTGVAPPPPTGQTGGNVPVPRFKPAQHWLAVHRDDAGAEAAQRRRAQRAPVIVRQDVDRTGWPVYSHVRSFAEESVTRLEDAAHVVSHYDPAGWRIEEVPVTDHVRYARLRAIAPNASCHLRVPRNAIARVILELAIDVARLHAEGEVHGDLKPSNVLVGARGVHVFDSLRLSPGARAPAMTRGWAAPEQVLGNPVGPATDQVPIGMMLLALLEGVPFGEETRVVIPVGGRRLEAHTVLRNPGVFIDPDTAPIEADAVEAWRALVEQCIRFEPERRFPATMSLIDALRRLVERRTLKGHLDVPVGWGTQVLMRAEGDEVRAAWLAG